MAVGRGKPRWEGAGRSQEGSGRQGASWAVAPVAAVFGAVLSSPGDRAPGVRARRAAGSPGRKPFAGPVPGVLSGLKLPADAQGSAERPGAVGSSYGFRVNAVVGRWRSFLFSFLNCDWTWKDSGSQALTVAWLAGGLAVAGKWKQTRGRADAPGVARASVTAQARGGRGWHPSPRKG